MTDKPKPVVTHDDLLSALTQELSRPPTGAEGHPEAFTARELCERLGMGKVQVGRLLDQLRAQDRLRVTWVLRQDRAGRWGPRPAYYVDPEEPSG